MKSRFALLFIILLGFWGSLLFRGVTLKLFPDARLRNLQKQQFETTLKIRSRRGAITDRNGKELAVSMASYSLFADPAIIENKTEVARKLARLFRVSYRSIANKIKSESRRFVWLERHLDQATRETIKSWNVRGLGFIEESRRVYPNDSLLSQVLGFTGREGYGLEGLELEYDEELRGREKRILVPRDARGRPLLADSRVLMEVPDGNNIELTIDSEVQFALERELHEIVKGHGAERAMGVVLKASNSEILAMATSPGYNLNSATNYTGAIRKNRVITDAFEPGSTMKTFVAAAGLKHGIFRPSTKFDCEGGRFQIGRRWITEADSSHEFDELTVSEVLIHSSNIGATKMAFEVGDDILAQTLKEFGFGDRLGIDLPGEGRGIMRSLPWRKHLLSNISFGHGIAATALQVTNAYAAIANGGKLYRPRIVKAIVDPVTGEKVTFNHEPVRTVLTQDQASTLTLMLTQAAGPSARIPGYPVAGKTGTAQKVDTEKGGYLQGQYISSFAGFVPAHSPEYVIYIAVDSPKEDYYGAQVAAPAFSRMAGFLVRRAGIPPVLISKQNVIDEKPAQEDLKSRAIQQIQKFVSGSEQQDILPNLVGLSLRQAMQQLQGRPLGKLTVKGSGIIVRTNPEAGTKLDHEKKLVLQMAAPGERREGRQ